MDILPQQPCTMYCKVDTSQHIQKGLVQGVCVVLGKPFVGRLGNIQCTLGNTKRYMTSYNYITCNIDDIFLIADICHSVFKNKCPFAILHRLGRITVPYDKYPD